MTLVCCILVCVVLVLASQWGAGSYLYLALSVVIFFSYLVSHVLWFVYLYQCHSWLEKLTYSRHPVKATDSVLYSFLPLVSLFFSYTWGFQLSRLTNVFSKNRQNPRVAGIMTFLVSLLTRIITPWLLAFFLKSGINKLQLAIRSSVRAEE